jgi:LL-diaminopimelate aminotransferase
MEIAYAERVKNLPPYIFAQLENIINEKKKKGLNLISLSIGDPDLPPPSIILEALKKESSNPNNHNYSFSQGEPNFKLAVAEWYKNRFNVDLDPEKEVIALIGSKEGLANIARAFVNPKDKVFVPNPSYPVYANGATILSCGIPITMPLFEENNFEPDFDTLNSKNAKMIYLNYPNNPTGSVIKNSTLRKIVEIGIDKKTIICYDNAYSEITFDGYKAPSIMEIEGGKEVAIEFHSCSKTFNMTGDRIGFAVGNSRLIEGLLKVKKQIDSGPPVYIQKVAEKALKTYSFNETSKDVKKIVDIYCQRRDLLVKGLCQIGIKCKKPLGTFYLWIKCEDTSMDFCQKLLDVGVVITPGSGFGKYGEGYVRFAFTQPKEKIIEAVERIRQVL